MQAFNLHAAVRCAADDRRRLEQPCRFITRPALAFGRSDEPQAAVATGADLACERIISTDAAAIRQAAPAANSAGL